MISRTKFYQLLVKIWSKLSKFGQISSFFGGPSKSAKKGQIWLILDPPLKKWHFFGKMSASPVLAILFLGDFQVNLPLIRRNWPNFGFFWVFWTQIWTPKFHQILADLGTFGPKRSPRMVTKYPPTINTWSARTLDDFAIYSLYINICFTIWHKLQFVLCS